MRETGRKKDEVVLLSVLIPFLPVRSGVPAVSKQMNS